MKSFNALRRSAGVVALLSAAIAAALVVGASTGDAATNFTITLSPLIGTANVNEIPQVSYGGKIGYELFIRNSGDSTTQHATILVTSNLATFSDSDSASCAVNPKDAHQMICTPYGGTFVPGATFNVKLRFTAPGTGPAGGDAVSTSAKITVSAQTVGGKKNGTNGTTVAESAPVPTNVVENTTKADTYLHVNENAATGSLSINHPQNFTLSTPTTTLLGDPFGIALSIHDNVGTPICSTCLTSFTTLTIPTAPFVSTPLNPFYDGTKVNPYGWTMRAQYSSSSFKLTGVYHLEDGASVPDFVPSCASIGGAPTVDDPLCWDTLTQNKGSRTLIGTGRGLENGNIGFG